MVWGRLALITSLARIPSSHFLNRQIEYDFSRNSINHLQLLHCSKVVFESPYLKNRHAKNVTVAPWKISDRRNTIA